MSLVCIISNPSIFLNKLTTIGILQLKNMEISFKPAILSSLKTWEVSNSQLTTPKGETLDLGGVTQAHFVNMPIKRRWIVELKLTTPDDAVTIVCNDTLKGQNRAQCFVLIATVLKSLQVCNPELKIRYGYGRITNYMLACVGLIPVGFGLSFMLDGLANNFDTFPLVMGLGFLLLGAFWIWCISPWKAASMHTPQQLYALLVQQPNVPL